MSISGHKTEAVYCRYDIVSPEDLKIARAKMENYIQQQQPEDGGSSDERPITEPPAKHIYVS